MPHYSSSYRRPPPPLPDPATLPFPSNLIRLCTDCDLAKGCRAPVPGVGPTPARVLLLGQNPGKEEDLSGTPFVGKAGVQLNSLLSSCGLPRESVYITNCLRCLTPNNSPPKSASVLACSKWLDIELSIVNPQIIVAMGAFAIRHMLGDDAGTVEHLHGRPIEMANGRIVLPCYHPAAPMHGDTSLLRFLYEDFQVLRGLVNDHPVSEYHVVDEHPTPDYRVADTPALVQRMLDEVRESGQASVDTETTDYGTKLWSIQVSPYPGKSWFVPFTDGKRLLPMSGKRVDLTEWGAHITVHFYLNDIEWLDIPDDNFTDTMVLAYLLGLPQGLKELASRLCGMKMRSYSEVVRPGQHRLSLAYLKDATEYRVPGIPTLVARTWPDPPIVEEAKWDNKAGMVVVKQKHPWHISRKIKGLLDKLEAADTDPDFDPLDRWSGASKGIPYIERAVVERVLGKMPESSLADIPFSQAAEYACKDSDATSRVAIRESKLIQESGLSFVRWMDLGILPMVNEMMQRGFPLDTSHLSTLSKEYTLRMAAKAAELAGIVGHSFNPSSSTQVAQVVYGELGFKPTAFTPTKLISTDDSELKKAKHPVTAGIISYRRLSKIKGTYTDSLVQQAVPDGLGIPRLHTTLKTTRVETGRLCIAKGTLIDVARDLSATHLMGIPIETVRVGDWAYTYDNNLQLTLNKVVWVGRTGHKKVVRIHWVGTGRHSYGYVDLTPEHLVRRIDGSYVPARDLVPWQDHILALSRDIDSCGYSRLYITGQKSASRENRVIAARFGDIRGRHIHHNNGNKSDNRPENLTNMGVTEHLRWEGIHKSPETRKRTADTMKELYATGKRVTQPKCGADNPNWLGLSRDWMLSVLWGNAGKPTTFTTKYGIDYETAQKYLVQHGIDYRDIKRVFNARGELVTEDTVHEAIALGREQGQEAAMKFIGLGYYRFRKLQEHYKVAPYNHEISAVEILDSPVDVYDLEVEETHNLIANGICVSNSSSAPNLQNIPARSKDGKAVRMAFVAGPGRKLFEADYSQIEMVTLAHLSRCKRLIELFLRGGDPHTEMASHIFGVPMDQAKLDKYRYPMKRVNFGVAYLIGPKGLSNQIQEYVSDLAMEGTPADIEPWDEPTCEKFLNEWYKLNPEVKDFQFEMAAMARRYGFVADLFGRRRYIPEVMCPIKEIQEAGVRQAANMPVTATAQGIIKIAMGEIWRELPSTGWRDMVEILMQIHDSLVVSAVDDETVWRPYLAWMVKIMTEGVKLRVPVKVDVKMGFNWAEMEKVKW